MKKFIMVLFFLDIHELKTAEIKANNFVVATSIALSCTPFSVIF